MRDCGAPLCPWGGNSLPGDRRHGGVRQFCSRRCRHAFHSAARQWAIEQFQRGLVTVADFQAIGQDLPHYHASEACTLRLGLPVPKVKQT